MMAGQSSAEVEAFFSTLPSETLSPLEVALRQALLDFLHERWPKPFPLAEWIDRRIGGEVEVRRDAAGRDELLARAPPAAPEAAGAAGPGREAFLAGLDPGAFSAEEEALRDAVFEFLARWKSRELATLADLAADAGVRHRAAALLPGDAPLKEWIELRIGGEVEFKSDARGQEIVHLTPKARPVVTAKYEQLAASAAAAAPTGKGQGRPRQPAQTPGLAARPAQPPSAQSHEAFFAGLPQGELSPGELTLRAALLERLERWPRGPAPGKPAGAWPPLSELARDPQVLRCRGFLPQNIPLKEWIDRRIGGEIEVHKDERGHPALRPRGAAASGGRAPSPRPRGAGERRAGPAELAEDFISKLPVDRHTEAEADLRQAILGYLEAKDMVPLSEMSKDSQIAQYRSACLPPEVPLRVWLDRRIGGEVETIKDNAGRIMAQMRGNCKGDADPPGPEREEQRERFFAGLPQDGFTPEEDRLREALLDFLANWKEKDLPTLSHAGGDVRVKKCRAKVLPKGVHVTLRDWIDRRIGGEVEMFEAPSGQLQFGIRGQASPAARKRGAGGGEQGPAWKKGGAPGAPQDRSGSWN